MFDLEVFEFVIVIPLLVSIISITTWLQAINGTRSLILTMLTMNAAAIMNYNEYTSCKIMIIGPQLYYRSFDDIIIM